MLLQPLLCYAAPTSTIGFLCLCLQQHVAHCLGRYHAALSSFLPLSLSLSLSLSSSRPPPLSRKEAKCMVQRLVCAK